MARRKRSREPDVSSESTTISGRCIRCGTRDTRKNLPPGEEVQYEGRPSRIALLAKPVFGILVAVALFAWIAARQNSQGHTTLTTVLSLGFILDVIVSVVRFLRAYIWYKSAEYVVTDRRVVGKYGFLRTRSVDVLMTQISGINVSQSGSDASLDTERYGSTNGHPPTPG